ncbi:MAG: C2H2-type zinc finger protein [Chloroflexi bacterium]|nr:C2H2-type zinc finger protein [Chloroflexota bacterium]
MLLATIFPYTTFVNRGSKYNPYQCPECGYKTTRRANLKVHLARVHGLAPYLPEQSKEDWVNSQCRALADQHAEAQLDGDKRRAGRLYGSLTALFYNHQDVLTVGHISRAIERAKKKLETRNQ